MYRIKSVCKNDKLEVYELKADNGKLYIIVVTDNGSISIVPKLDNKPILG